MPAIMTAPTGQAQALQRRIYGNREKLVKHAWIADGHHQESTRAETDLGQWREKYSRFSADVEPRTVTIYYVLVGALFAIYAADCILLGSVIEFLSGINFEGREWLMTTARFVFPAVVVVMELGFASLGLRASEMALNGLGSRNSVWFWNFWATFMALVMPAGVVALFLVSAPDLPGLVRLALLVALFALALAGHIMVLFGRQNTLDAITFVRFRFGEGGMQTKARRSNLRMDSEHRHVSRHFTEYAGDLNNYNGMFPGSRMAAEPFDTVTLRVVRRVFGQDAIQIAENGPRPRVQNDSEYPGSNARPPQAQPAPPPPSESPEQGESDSEYLRTILQRRQRDEDSEVRP